VPAVDEEVRALEVRMMTAVAQRDMATLERLVGDDFTLTTGRPGAEVRSRAEWMHVTQSDYVLDSFTFEELDVRVYPGCAIVRARYSQTAAMEGRPRNTTYRLTDVWIGGPGEWRLQARHAQPVAGD
jgi:ketosteroid isomerase-like protein